MRLAVLACATLAGAGAGCGSGDSGGEETTPLTKREFLARGDRICAEGRKQFLELQEDPPRTAEDAAELTRRLVAISEGEVEEMRALHAPEELRQPLERYLRAREEGIEILREGQRAAERGDARAYARAQTEAAEGQVRRARLATAVGFTECSRPLTAGD